MSPLRLSCNDLPVDQRVPQIAQRARTRLSALAQILGAQLRGRDYLLGAEFSGADIAIGYCCNWAAYVGHLDDNPTIVGYHNRLRRRPADRRVFSTA